MSGDANLNPQQLSMFMSARELSRINYGDAPGNRRRTRAEVRASKHLENQGGIYLHPDKLSEWLAEPVDVSHDYPTERSPLELSDGHHRMVHAMRTNPDMLFAVNHHDRENWH